MRIGFLFTAMVLVVTIFIGCVEESKESLPDLSKILAAADAADGSVDSVVHLCAVCSLSMNGDQTIASTYADYSFHHCSAHCKETFDYDPVAVLDRLE